MGGYVRKVGLLCVWVEPVISRQDLLRSTVGCLSRNLHSNYSQWCLSSIIRGRRHVNPQEFSITTQVLLGRWNTKSSTELELGIESKGVNKQITSNAIKDYVLGQIELDNEGRRYCGDKGYCYGGTIS